MSKSQPRYPAESPKLKNRSHAKILVLTRLRDESLHDKAVLAGASGVVRKEAPAQTILAAIEKVHEGELWLDRITTGQVFYLTSQQRMGLWAQRRSWLDTGDRVDFISAWKNIAVIFHRAECGAYNRSNRT